MFASLSDRLTATFRNLRGKGRLSEQDINTTVSEIRRALLEADVALPVVREFTAAVRERVLGAEVSSALNPGQQVVKIVNAELVEILGGQARDLHLAKRPPTVIMLAGLQGAGKTTLAGKLAKWLKDQGQTPLLVASDLQRPNAVTQLQVVGERAGVPVFAPHPGAQEGAEAQGAAPAGDPVAVEEAGKLCSAAGAKRVLPLKVSGAFHSPLMEPAVEGLREALSIAAFAKPRFGVVANATAELVRDLDDARELLGDQLTAPVRWVESMQLLARLHPDAQWLELGPGAVLTGLLRRIVPDARCTALSTADDVQTWLAA